MPTQCTEGECPFFSWDCWKLHTMDTYDTGDPEEDMDIDEEATTEPRGLAAWLPTQDIRQSFDADLKKYLDSWQSTMPKILPKKP